MFNEVVFDVETKKWFDEVEERDPEKLGASVVSAYSRKIDDDFGETEGKIQSFWEEDLDELWKLFQEADRIIGFNSINFDVPVLTPYANFPIEKLPHFDVMDEVKKKIGRRIALDDFAKETLGRAKTEQGSMATELWRRGDEKSLKRLQEYCEEDVMITKDIYDFGLKNGHLKYKDRWNTSRTVDIDFSYPEEEKEDKQIGLF